MIFARCRTRFRAEKPSKRARNDSTEEKPFGHVGVAKRTDRKLRISYRKDRERLPRLRSLDTGDVRPAMSKRLRAQNFRTRFDLTTPPPGVRLERRRWSPAVVVHFAHVVDKGLRYRPKIRHRYRSRILVSYGPVSRRWSADVSVDNEYVRSRGLIDMNVCR